jgi:structural maintenance of chromosome 1
MKEMKESHKSEKLKMEEYHILLEKAHLNNDNTEKELKEKIKANEQQIQSYIDQLNKCNGIIDEKEEKIKDLNLIIIQNKERHEELRTKLENISKEIDEKDLELKRANKNNMEIKSKGKNMLEKYDEVLIRNKEEIKTLKETLSQNNLKISRINDVIKAMEEEKNQITEKLDKAHKNISEYLETIALLHQQNITYEKEKKLILKEKEQLEKKMNIFFEPFSTKIPLNKSLNMNNSYISNSNNHNNNSKEYIQLKKEYEKIKNNYDDLIKTLEPKNENNVGKIRRIQDLVDKLKLNENDLNQYKNIIKNSIIKLGEHINININIFKEKCTLENKYDSIIQFVIDYINKKNNEIQQLNEQKEILLKNIKTNNLKKELFEFLNSKNNKNGEESKKNDLSTNINKIREGYWSKQLNNQNKNCKIIKGFDYCSNKPNDNNNNCFLFQKDKENYMECNIISKRLNK